jgi:hypothetical protein
MSAEEFEQNDLSVIRRTLTNIYEEVDSYVLQVS